LERPSSLACEQGLRLVGGIVRIMSDLAGELTAPSAIAAEAVSI